MKIIFICFKWIYQGVCDNYLYQKSDGSLKCGTVIDHGLDLFQATSQCGLMNSIIPEFPNPNDQQIFNIIRVILSCF